MIGGTVISRTGHRRARGHADDRKSGPRRPVDMGDGTAVVCDRGSPDRRRGAPATASKAAASVRAAAKSSPPLAMAGRMVDHDDAHQIAATAPRPEARRKASRCAPSQSAPTPGRRRRRMARTTGRSAPHLAAAPRRYGKHRLPPAVPSCVQGANCLGPDAASRRETISIVDCRVRSSRSPDRPEGFRAKLAPAEIPAGKADIQDVAGHGDMIRPLRLHCSATRRGQHVSPVVDAGAGRGVSS